MPAYPLDPPPVAKGVLLAKLQNVIASYTRRPDIHLRRPVTKLKILEQGSSWCIRKQYGLSTLQLCPYERYISRIHMYA